MGGSFSPSAQLALRRNMMIQGLNICLLVLCQRWPKCRTAGWSRRYFYCFAMIRNQSHGRRLCYSDYTLLFNLVGSGLFLVKTQYLQITWLGLMAQLLNVDAANKHIKLKFLCVMNKEKSLWNSNANGQQCHIQATLQWYYNVANHRSSEWVHIAKYIGGITKETKTFTCYQSNYGDVILFQGQCILCH